MLAKECQLNGKTLEGYRLVFFGNKDKQDCQVLYYIVDRNE
jgi:hypothetical protein